MIFVQRVGTTGSVQFSGDRARLLDRDGNVAFDWTSGGTISGIPQGDGYTLQVQKGAAIASEALAVGATIFAMGQSNMLGWFSTPTALPSASSGTYQMASNGSIGQVTGAAANYFATNYAAATGIPVLMVSAAVGATYLLPGRSAYWLDRSAGSLYDTSLKLLAKVGGAAELVLWAQGEQDAMGSTVSKAEYAAGLTTFMNRVLSDFRPDQILIQELGIRLEGPNPRFDTIRSAQREVADAMDGVTIAALTGDLSNMEDALHLTGASRVFAADRMLDDALAFKGIVYQRTVWNGRDNAGEGDDFTGLDTGDELHGLGGDDRLDGAGGNDFIEGGAGNDRLIGGAGIDLISGNAGNDAIDGGDDADVISGGSGNDIILGGAGNDEIWGDSGDDAISGEAGDDFLVGGAGNDTLDGGSGADNLLGGGGNDQIFGGAGNDTIDGGEGADAMSGGAGNDLYSVENAGDTVDESGDTSGVDRVVSTVSFDLSDPRQTKGVIETLTLGGSLAINGTGNDAANRMVGNNAANVLIGKGGDDYISGLAGDDTLQGDAGNDRLDGGAGADTMRGGAGNDIYDVDNAGDVVDETGDATGIDLVNSSVSFVLGANLENLVLAGTAAIDGTGNDLANRITGNSAANTLRGGGGDDILSGGAGADTLQGDAGRDTLSGGAGADLFVFGPASPASTDRIVDFSRVEGDQLAFGAADYGLTVGRGLASNGTLAADWFEIGTAATKTHGEFLFNSATRTLMWDADGSGREAAVAIASFTVPGNILLPDFLRSSDFRFSGARPTPEKPGVGLLSDSGSSSSDAITNDARLIVTTAASNTLSYAVDGGAFSANYDPAALADGRHRVAVVSKDADGNASAQAIIEFTLDRAAPAAPSVVLVSDTGASAEDGVTSSASLLVTPSETGGVLSYAVDGGAAATNYDPVSLADGRHWVAVAQTDAAGNVSATTMLEFTLDRSAPSAPAVALASDTGLSATDGLTREAALLVVPAELGGRLSFAVDGGAASSAYDPTTLADGHHTVMVVHTDAAGNVSAGTTLNFTLDTTAPASPIVALTALATTPAEAGVVTRDASLTVLPAEPGGSLAYVVDGKAAEASYDPTALSDGDHSVVVTQVDAAGNISTASSIAFTLDRTTPVAPFLSLVSDTGSSFSDRITRSAAIDVVASAGGVGLRYVVDGGAATTDYDPAGLADGDHTVIVTSIGADGRSSLPSTMAFTLDRTAASAPAIALLSDTGESSSDGITRSGAIAVTVSEGGGSLGWTCPVFVESVFDFTRPAFRIEAG